MALPQIDLKKYTYHLPDEKIADFPLEERDSSKLLYYSESKISDKQFKNLPEILESDSLLVFNNSKVISARLFFQKESGAKIEILLDNPLLPSLDPAITLNQEESCSWQCIIGNKKRWKESEELRAILNLDNKDIILTASWENRERNMVKFSWTEHIAFLNILENVGHVPLPPYIKREDSEKDKKDYQTVYAKKEGAVAAPTAGLHFTDRVIRELTNRDIGIEEITLHVGAGTFQPIKTDDVNEHQMHSERVFLSRNSIERFLNHKGKIIPVGTTAMRSLESLYWFGHHLQSNGDLEFQMDKNYPYEIKEDLSREEALRNVLNWMDKRQIDNFSGKTSIFIVPGYKFKMADALITNFHQPGTTLILLIAAFIGEDWKKVYEHALISNYRFLSYGDSSLLLPNFTP